MKDKIQEKVNEIKEISEHKLHKCERCEKLTDTERKTKDKWICFNCL